MAAPVLPADAALLLDMDGTLIDIAPTPQSVVVPPMLPGVLVKLREQCAGALAIVTGRPIEDVERLLPGIPTAIAGEHGGVFRFAPGAPLHRADLPALPDAWVAAAEAAIAAHPGTLFERKARGFALHFRQAPEAGPALEQAVRRIVGGAPTHFILAGSMTWEVKPHGADKETAVRTLMARAPFAGRVPVYIGDDVTDEDGIRAAIALGGVGWRVPEVFGDAAGVRAWLAAQAG